MMISLSTRSKKSLGVDNIDKNTYYKDADYWELYEAVETFLYGELNPNETDGDYWGIRGFSLLWEDMCHTYFFTNYHYRICYADTDITVKGYKNTKRDYEEQNRVGNWRNFYENLYGNQWSYRTISNIEHPLKSGLGIKLGWNELICLEYNLNYGTFINDSEERYSDFTKLFLRRFFRPDLVLKSQSGIDLSLEIIDYKDVSVELYINPKSSPQFHKKYRNDIIKQLTYELALQQTHIVSQSLFFIPFYYGSAPKPDPLGEIEPSLDLKGIKVFKANFFLIQENYLEENL